MKTILLSKLIFFSVFTGYGQNLVDNWSFEDTVFCPIGPGQMHAAGWKLYGGTPDYYNACHNGASSYYNNVGVPYNRVGYQIPHSGDAYVGLLTMHSFATNAREFPGRELNSPLQIGTKYYVSFYTVRAINFDTLFPVNIAINKIGINFSTVEHLFPNGGWPINLNSQVYADSIITDTTNWTKISGSFIADSAYICFSISNFFPDTLTDTINYSSVFGYYFIDDICVSPDSNYCDQLQSINNNESSFIRLFPNPANEWFEINGENIESLEVYDMSGKLVYKKYEPPGDDHVLISTIDFADGLYLLRYKQGEQSGSSKFVIQH